MKSKIILTLILIGSVSCLLGQGLNQEIERIFNGYTRAALFQSEINIRIYQTGKLDIPLDERMISLKRKGKGSIFEFGTESSVLMTDSLMLTIRNKQRTIEIGNLGSTEQNVEILDPSSLKNAVEKASNIDLISKSSSLKSYKLTYDEGTLEHMIIDLDSVKLCLKRIEYYYRTNKYSKVSKVQIEYRTWDVSPIFINDFLSLSNYISIQGDVIKPSQAYKDYEVLRGF